MHQTIIKTLDKKNNLDEMIDKRNLMINAELNDKLRKDLTVNIYFILDFTNCGKVW